MTTYKELIYLILDLAKNLSDDSSINENHVAYLIDKYRAYLLKQKYEKDINRSVSNSNYQTICIDLMEVPMIAGCSDACVCSATPETYLRSKRKLPALMNLGEIKVAGNNMFRDNFNLVSYQRMQYIGHNTWLKNMVYCCIAPDNYLYFKSSNPAFLELRKVHLTAIFDDTITASQQAFCEGETPSGSCPAVPCDEWEREFPMEDSLLTQLVSLVLTEVTGAAFRPKDNVNNANDDLADIASFVRQNMKSGFANAGSWVY